MLKEKRVLVTGGARGNGDGIVCGMLENHAEVIVFDLLKGERESATYIKVDLSDKEALKEAYGQQTKRTPFDILINDAGISTGNPSEEYEIEQWNRTIDINLTVPFLLSQMFAKSLIAAHKPGCIINITSLGAEFGFVRVGKYAYEHDR